MKIYFCDSFPTVLYIQLDKKVYVLSDSGKRAPFAKSSQGLQWRETLWKLRKLEGKIYFDNHGCLFLVSCIGVLR